MHDHQTHDHRFWLRMTLGLCALAVQPAFSPPARSAAAPDDSARPASSDYRIGVNDRVTISVFGEDELSREYTISPEGKIALPLAGEIDAKGLTASELRRVVEQRLGDGFINKPTITVAVTGFRNFYILGEVNKPGEYPYESGITITQAVAEAAGFTYRAARRRVFIRHEGETAEARIDVKADIPVRPGDTIRFGERYF